MMQSWSGRAWQAPRKVELIWQADGDEITFHDSRYAEEPAVLTFGPHHRAVFEACAGTVRSIDAIAELARRTAEDVRAAREELADARVVFREERSYLGLATPRAHTSEEPHFQRKWVVA